MALLKSADGAVFPPLSLDSFCDSDIVWPRQLISFTSPAQDLPQRISWLTLTSGMATASPGWRRLAKLYSRSLLTAS